MTAESETKFSWNVGNTPPKTKYIKEKRKWGRKRKMGDCENSSEVDKQRWESFVFFWLGKGLCS